MAGKRMLHKNIFTSKKINKLSAFAETLFVRIYLAVDDYGEFYSDAGTIKEVCFPVKKIELSTVKSALKELKSMKLVSFLARDGRHILKVNRFNDFQKFRSDRQKHSLFGMTDGIPLDIPPDIPEDKAKAKAKAKAKEGEGRPETPPPAASLPPDIKLEPEGGSPPMDPTLTAPSGLSAEGLAGGPADHLWKILLSQNRPFFKAYPKQVEKFSFAISNALANGWEAEDIEKEIYEIAGKLNSIKPWEWLKEVKHGKHRSTFAEDQANLARILSGG
jgi:hypothetical protein